MTQTNDRSSHGAVNLAELLTRVESDLDLLGELIGVFKEEFPPLLQSLRQSIATEELKNVVSTSHTLKGMLSGLSVTRGAAIASRIEQMGRDGKTSELADALTLLESEVANLAPELDSYVAKTKP